MTDTRFRILMMLLMAGLVGVIWTLPTWWPVLNQDSISGERFPGLAEELQPQFVELPNADRALYFALYNGDDELEIPPQEEWALALVQARLQQEDVLAPDAEQPFSPPDGSSIVAEGTFSGVDAIRNVEGDLTIYQETNTGRRFMRFETNFGSDRAPDIHVIFTRNPDPLDERGVGVDYIDLGELQGNVGAQLYEVPDAVGNFEEYVVLALYSEAYDAVLGTATIR